MAHGAHANIDREILRLAIPAFGALVAEPLYVLADTAIVGHLGRHPLGGLGVAGTILSVLFSVFNFLAYGTTAAVARHIGAGRDTEAAECGIAGLWLAVIIGVAVAVVGLTTAMLLVRAVGPSAAVRAPALTYLRISLVGAPFVLIAFAATGYLRGTQDTMTPFVVAVGANVINLALEILFVYVLHLGIAGSAWGTVAAQLIAAAAYLAFTARRVIPTHATLRFHWSRVRATAVVGSHLMVRTGSLLAAFFIAAAVATHLGDVQIAAHQVAWQLWLFLALALDAIAIAGQAIVGRALGAGDELAVRASTRRMLRLGWWAGVGAGAALIIAKPWLVELFTNDHAVRAELANILWVAALMQPVAALVFVLDGILIGAGDSVYLAKAMAAATALFVPCALAVAILNGSLVALWIALYVFIVARLYGMARRYRGQTWLV